MIFTIYMALVTVFGVMFAGKISNVKKVRAVYCFFCGFVLFLIAALRSTAVGYDSGQYARLFSHINKLNYVNIFSKFDDEPLFYAMLKFLSSISDNPNFMFAVIGAVFAICISLLIYKYSEIPYISFVMLIPMQFFPFTLSGCRQAVALSFVIIAFSFIVNRSFFKAILTYIIAYLFHNSVIIALPLILIYFFKNKIIARISFVVCFFFTYIFRKPLLEFITTYIYTDYDVFDNEAGSLTTLIMYFCIYVMSMVLINTIAFQKETDSIILHKHYDELCYPEAKAAEKSVYNFLECMLALGIIIQIFVPLQPNIFRAAMYYQLASILIVPKAVTNIPNKLFRVLAIMAFFLIMAVLYYKFTYYSAGANPYTFYWHN